jgi:glycosyltransferase involved in cell wall biosynthesis
MEVLMLTNATAPDRVGGLERYVRELAASLVERGVSVTIHAKQIDPAHPRSELCADGVVIRRYPISRRSSPIFAVSYPIRSAAAAAVAAAKHRGAIIHAHYALPAIALAATHRDYLYTFHAPVYRELLSERADSYLLPRVTQGVAVAGVRAAERLVLRNAATVVVLSEFMRGEIRALDASTAHRAHTIPGGVNLERFAPVGDDGAPWGTTAAPRLFCARRLTPRTGVRELLHAMPQIRSAFPNACLAVAGQGRLGAELRSLASELDLDCVSFLGPISDAELCRWYASADLVLMPTQELEGFGLATVEALACGAAVLGTPAGATPEILRSLDPLLVTPGNSPTDIAAATIALLRQPDRLALIRGRARSRAAGYAWSVVADRYLDLYPQLCARTTR